jgi:hypothetical protein
MISPDLTAADKMPRTFTAKTLTGDQSAQAFPVIQTIVPSITLEHWNDFVHLLTHDDACQGRQAGIMTVQSERGYIHGLFCYTVGVDIHHGPVLSIENFVALDLVERELAIKALVNAMEKIAHRLDCHAIHVHLPDELVLPPESRQWLLSIFEGAGHRVETVRLCKHLRRVK